MKNRRIKDYCKNIKGFTLIEIVVSLVIIAMVFALGFSVFSFGTSIFSRGEERANEQQIVRFVTNFIAQELRFATHLEVFEPLVENNNFVTDLNYLFVEDGTFMYREAFGSKTERFSDIDERVYLADLEFEFDVTKNTISFTVAAIDKDTDTEKYSLSSGFRLLNTIDNHNPGTEGIAIAYKSERWIPISNAQDLSYVGKGVKTFSNGNTYNATLSSKYFLINTINLSSFPDWEPIGSDATNPFQGFFYGNGYSIYDLSIDRSFPTTNNNNQGLFGVTEGARLQDIKLKNVTISGYQNVGGLVGHSINTRIEDCSVTGIITGADSNSQKIGGLVGFNEDNSTINQCHFNGHVLNNGHETGGLVGLNSTGSKILKSYVHGTVEGQNKVGGLVGSNNNSSIIEECYAAADVGGDDHVGGFVGYNQTNAIIKNCYATGNVNGNNEVGGLVGSNHQNSTIVQCYSISEVTYTGIDIGGLVGRQDISSTTENSYWDIDSSGLGEEGTNYGEGKTTTEMIDQSTYSGWNFFTIWSIKSNHYPCLKWQNELNCPQAIFDTTVPSIPASLQHVFANEMALFASLETVSESEPAEPAIKVTGSAKICGTLGTNATGLNSIQFGPSNNILVDGDLYLGYGADPDEVITVQGWGRTIDDVLTEGHTVENNTEVVLFPSLVFPDFPEELEKRDDFKTPWKSGGYYEISEDGEYDLIEVTSSRTLTIDLQGGPRILRTKKFNVQGTVELKNVGTDGKLLLFIEEEFSTSGNRDINVTGDGAGNPAAFNVFIKDDNSFPSHPNAQYNFVGNVFTEYGDVFIGSSSSFIGHLATLGENVEISGSADSRSGLIYAPNANVTISGSGSVRGTIIGDSLKASGGSRCAIIFELPDMSSFPFEFESN